MNVRLSTPSRLHFGLIDFNGELGRIDGGAGVAISRPRNVLSVCSSSSFRVNGSDPDLIKGVARKICDNLGKPLPAHGDHGGRADPQPHGLWIQDSDQSRSCVLDLPGVRYHLCQHRRACAARQPRRHLGHRRPRFRPRRLHSRLRARLRRGKGQERPACLLQLRKRSFRRRCCAATSRRTGASCWSPL